MHRDPEIIRRDIMIADLKASNCALQGGEMLTRIQLLQQRVELCKANQASHDAQKADFEEELKTALTAREAAAPSKPLVPLELVVNGQQVRTPTTDAAPSSSEPGA
jgi:hypothetical protein